MRLRNTLLLALIFILLGAYVYFYELNKKEEDKERLLSFKNDEVEAVAFSHSGQEIKLEKDSSGKWKITEPLQTAADESTISDILFTLSTSEVTRSLETNIAPQDLKGFGLEQPWVKVAITLRGGRSLAPILVGERTPVGNSVYVQREGEAAVLLSSPSLLSSLDKKLYDFRDKTIIEFKKDAVKQYSFKGTKGEFVLAKKAEDWFIEEPKADRANQAEVLGMLSTIHNMTAQHFVEEPSLDLGRYGLDQPRLRATLFTGEGQREIFFGDKREGKDEVYMTLDSKEKVYSVYESVFKELDKDLSALRSKEVVPFSRDKVAKLRIRNLEESWTLLKGEENEWRLKEPKEGKVRAEVVEDYLTTLEYLRAKGFADDRPKDKNRRGLESPTLKISLQTENGEDLGTLLSARTAAGDYYAKREDSPTVYRIEEVSYNQLNKQLSHFLEEESEANQPASPTAGK